MSALTAALIGLATLLVIVLVVTAPWWLMVLAILIGWLWYLRWDHVQMRRHDRERIEPTEGRRR